VPHDVIESTVRAEQDPAQTVELLVKSTLDHGGPDNVTLLAIDVVG
jgi:serine/threonine protein phosphatase PrpC